MKKKFGKFLILLFSGKTRLVQEIYTLCKEQKEQVYISNADKFESLTPYHAWREIFKNFLDKEKKFAQNVREQIDDDLMPLLNNVLPINYPETPRTLSMSAQIRSESTQSLLTKILTLVLPHCSLLILENAQW